MQDFTDQIAAIQARLNEAAGYLRIAELEMRLRAVTMVQNRSLADAQLGRAACGVDLAAPGIDRGF